MARLNGRALALVLGAVFGVGFAAPGPAGPSGLTAQAGTVVVVPGARYKASWPHRLLLGAHYRDLWTTPIRVEVLDLAGLTPTRCGGGRQTTLLRFEAAGGRQFVFRSVDKDPTLALPPELRATFARAILQDQVSSAHPAGALVVAPLLEAAQVLHATPRLAVLPEDPRWGAFPCVRAGLLGMIEERPAAGPDGEPGFAGAAEIVSTKRLLDRLEGNPDHGVDSRAFLAARLMDVYVGDWDRHHDQWRWARFDEGGRHWWRPIPHDRDHAFDRLDGLLVALAGNYQPQIVSFEEAYPSLFRLSWTGRVVDRRLLVDLERPVWDSVAAVLRARLTDSVIDAAVRRMPPELYAQNGADLARALRNRRDRLPEAAAAFYELLAGEVDVHATDQAELAEVERRRDGTVELRLARRGGGAPYFRRAFEPQATREIRVYLHGGDDRLVVRGAGSGPMLRVIGGGADDELVDSAGSGATRLYDDRGTNRFVRGADTKVDARPYEPPPADSVSLAPPRDWGSRWLPLAWVTFVPDVGLFLGGGLSRTGYGFRRFPYSSRVVLRAGYATAAQSYRAELTGEFRGPFAPAVAGVHLRASGIEIVRFHGFGNEIRAPRSDEFYKVRQQQFRVEPSLAFPLSGAAQLYVGPVLKFAETNPEPGSFLATTGPYYGDGSFAQVGARAGLRVDTRDWPAAATRGVLVSVGGVGYPAALDVTDLFGAVRGEAAGYLSAGEPAVATLALRVGGAKVWGDTVPFHEATFVGGATTVRGFAENRFAGDAALYGNAELRLRVAKFYLLLPGDLGVFGLADVGRVYLAGESSDRWHTGVGGGLWFAFLNRANTVSIAVARSDERTAVYVRAGFLY